MSTFNVTVCQLPDAQDEFADAWAMLLAHHAANPAQLLLLNEVPFDAWFGTSPEFDQARWTHAVERHRWGFSQLAGLGVTVLGTAPFDARGRRYNRAFLHEPESAQPGWWRRKSWLPDEEPVYEATWYSAAPDRPDVREVGDCRLGVLTCTEIWAMDWATKLGRAGAHVIATPRATGATSTDNWLAAGRVSALVSGCYNISSNRAGNGFGGNGWVFAPDGELLALTNEAEPFITVPLDLDVAENAKHTYPRYALWTRRWDGQ